MSISKKLFLILIFSILIRFIIILIYRENPLFSFQQEGYIYYIESLKNGFIKSEAFGAYDKRLFPGYLLLILPFTYFFNHILVIGILLNIIIFIISFYLIWKIFKNIFINFIFAFFPPVWLMQTSKASSEPLTIMLILSSLFVFLKKHFITAGFLIGLAFNVRIIAVCFLFAILVILFIEKNFKEIFKVLIGFMLSSSFLIIYNFFVFGKENLLIQFQNLDQNYGVVRIGFIQIFDDIYRTIDWGQYRILFSGSFYIFLNLISSSILFYFRKKDRIINLFFYWSLFSIIFVFSLSPFTLIENFGRYAIPILPAICLAIYLVINLIIEKLGFLPKKPKLTTNKKRMKTHK